MKTFHYFNRNSPPQHIYISQLQSKTESGYKLSNALLVVTCVCCRFRDHSGAETRIARDWVSNLWWHKFVLISGPLVFEHLSCAKVSWAKAIPLCFQSTKVCQSIQKVEQFRKMEQHNQFTFAQWKVCFSANWSKVSGLGERQLNEKFPEKREPWVVMSLSSFLTQYCS